jgi:amino acid transporter
MFSGAASVTTNLTYYLVALWHPDFVLQAWHFYLLFVFCLTLSLLLNIFGSRLLHAFDTVGIVWIVVGGVVMVVAALACAGTKATEPKFQSAKFVFTTFINTSDWNDFVLFMTGMVQPTFTITCFDAVAHIVDEMPNPRRDAPRCITMAVVFGAITTFLVVMPLMFVITDIDAVVGGAAGPLLEILYQATNSKAGATCLGLIPYIAILLQSQATLTTASRIVLTLANDDAIVFSSLFSRVHPTLNAPIPALVLPWAVSVLVGLLYLGSSVMFSSILSTTLVALGISYLIPGALTLCISDPSHRRRPPRPGHHPRPQAPVQPWPRARRHRVRHRHLVGPVHRRHVLLPRHQARRQLHAQLHRPRHRGRHGHRHHQLVRLQPQSVPRRPHAAQAAFLQRVGIRIESFIKL